MQEIPVPQVLDENRTLGHNADTEFEADSRSEAQLQKIALDQSCEYGRQLWHQLDAVRAYLLQALPPALPTDPNAAPESTLGAHPNSPDDDAGWRDWCATFAEVTSILCGPHGDSGYGWSEARHAEQSRRLRPLRPIPPAVGTPSDVAATDADKPKSAGAAERRGRRRGLFWGAAAGAAGYALLHRHHRPA